MADIIYANCKYCKEQFIRNRKDKVFCRVRCKQKNREFPWRSHKKEFCEACGFVAKHKIQLDVDHVDGNKNNNEPDNLRTLCANCHRLKTHLSEDYLNQY